MRKPPVESVVLQQDLPTGGFLAERSGTWDLTDKQWERLRRWVPAPSEHGRPISRSRRVLFNGVAWRVRVGSPWRDVPERYGPWSTVYWLFRTWQTAGIWALMIKMILALLDERGLLTWIVSVDSSRRRTHPPTPDERAHPTHLQREVASADPHVAPDVLWLLVPRGSPVVRSRPCV
jgi:transposase